MTNTTSRRNLLKSAGVGGLGAGLGLALGGTPAGAVETASSGPESVQNRGRNGGPQAQATITFGAWQGDQGWDRMDPNFDPIVANHHSLAPNDVQIRAGGSISCVISGFHQVVVYDDGTRPAQIDTSKLIIAPGGPPFPILIDDPFKRIYRGLNPGQQPLDRVESIQFSKPGTYLVICSVIFHFANDNMYGFVRVLP